MTDFSEAEWSALKARAAELGKDHGHNAGTWYEIPDADAARRVLTGITDGDPEVLDTLPANSLSGEYADSYSMRDLYRDLAVGPEDDSDDLDLCSAYQDAYRDAAVAEIERAAQYQVS